MKPVYSFFLIIFFCLSQFNKSQAINLSDYSKEESGTDKELLSIFKPIYEIFELYDLILLKSYMGSI